ncbi:hypothetical protein RJ55_04436 [Drechmeria coniospora]|nr:hypothetical protein RJ55_04436 [Drechmeria coniospora]
MVVIHTIPELQVDVVMDGQAAAEYATPDESVKKAEGGATIPIAHRYTESVTDRLHFEAHRHPRSTAELYGAAGERAVTVGKHFYLPSFHTYVPHTKPKSKPARIWHRPADVLICVVEEATPTKVAGDAKMAKTLGTICVSIAVGAGLALKDYAEKTRLPRSSTFELVEKSIKGKELSHGAAYCMKDGHALPKRLGNCVMSESYANSSLDTAHKVSALIQHPGENQHGRLPEQENFRLASEMLRMKMVRDSQANHNHGLGSLLKHVAEVSSGAPGF